MTYVYNINYQELDWDHGPIHDLGTFSNKRKAFEILRILINKKSFEMKQEDPVFSPKSEVHKSKQGVYVDLELDIWQPTWRFRLTKYKLDEVLYNDDGLI